LVALLWDDWGLVKILEVMLGIIEDLVGYVGDY